MYIAHLQDGIYGSFKATGKNKEEAVNTAWKLLASNWCDNPGEFDGEIRGREVWWYNREEIMLGVVELIR